MTALGGVAIMHNHSVQLIPVGFKLLILLWLYVLHDQAACCGLMGFVPVFFFTLQFLIEEIFVETERIWHVNAVTELSSVVIESFESHN